jgi:hypothetical protein
VKADEIEFDVYISYRHTSSSDKKVALDLAACLRDKYDARVYVPFECKDEALAERDMNDDVSLASCITSEKPGPVNREKRKNEHLVHRYLMSVGSMNSMDGNSTANIQPVLNRQMNRSNDSREIDTADVSVTVGADHNKTKSKYSPTDPMVALSKSSVYDEAYLALAKSLIFLPILSQEGMCNANKASHNLADLGLHPESDYDLVFGEWRLAAELQERGMLYEIIPFIVRDTTADSHDNVEQKEGEAAPAIRLGHGGEKIFSNYLSDAILQPVEEKLHELLHRQHYGYSYLSKQQELCSVRAIWDRVVTFHLPSKTNKAANGNAHLIIYFDKNRSMLKEEETQKKILASLHKAIETTRLYRPIHTSNKRYF